MAEPFATTADLVKRWRPLTAAEEITARELLDDASAEIRALRRGIDALLIVVPPATEPEIDPQVVKRVVCAMVKRSMLVPVDQLPVTSLQESAGPYAQTQSFANPTGDLFLTKGEKRMLGIGRQRAFSIDLLPPVRPDRGWVL